MSGDLLSLLTGGKESLGPSVDPNIDAAIRTIYGEADGEPDAGKLAVAAVIRNRAAASGKSMAEVVSEPGAFEAWADPKRHPLMEALTPDTPQYQALAKLVAPALSGEVDPTNGADHFYAPKLQADLGRQAPDWATGDGLQIGSHRFYKVGDGAGQPSGADDLLSILGAVKPDVPVEQNDLPPAAANPANPPTYPNKGGQQSAGENLVAGLGRGLRDVADTGLQAYSHIAPADSPDKVAATVASERAARDQFDRDYTGSANATAGRAGGSLVASAPLLAVGGEALAPALRALGPAGEFIAGAYKGNKLLGLGSRASAGAGIGGATSALTSSASDRPLAEQVGMGAAGGAILGAAIPAAAGVGRGVVNKLTGADAAITPAVRDLAATAVDKYGIPLRVSQIKGVGDRSMAVADSERIGQSGTGYAENNAEQIRAYTRAVTKTFGEDADKLSPEVMQKGKDRIGGVFSRVAASTTIKDGAKLGADLNGVVNDASQVLPDSDLAPLQRQVDNILTARDPNGSLSGASYQALVRKGSPLDRATESANPNLRHYAQQIRGVLDDALEANASQADAAALKEARWQYKNLMTVKNLAAKANVEGEISPRLLNGAVNASFKNRAFQGAGDLGELAQIGQTFLKEPPNSGTAPRLMKNIAALAAGGGAAADLGLAFHDPGTALKIAGLGALAGGIRMGGNAATGAYNRSALVRNLLLRPRPAPAPPIVVGGPIPKLLGGLNDNVVLPAGVLAGNRLLGSPQAKVNQ